MKRVSRFAPIGIAAVTAVLLTTTGCQSAPADEGAAGALTQVTVLYPGIAYEPLMLAEQQGYFADAGLELDIRAGGAPQDNLAQAIGKSADIVGVAWDTMVTSTAEGMPVEVLASNSIVSSTTDTSGVVVREDSKFDALTDLEGATVAFDSVGAGGTSEFETALTLEGVDPTSVTIVAIPYAGMQVALEKGQVDAVFPSAPFYEQIATADGNEVIANPVRETRKSVPITLWASTSQWLEENPETAEGFIEALDLGMVDYNDPEHLDDILQIRADVSQQPLESVPTALTEMRTAIDDQAAELAIEQLEKTGRVENPRTVEEIVWVSTPRV